MCPIDKVEFEFEVLTITDKSMVSVPPDDGCMVYGLFLEGASWDLLEEILSESNPKQLFQSMPMVPTIYIIIKYS